MNQVSTDPIADMLTRIRNGIAVNQKEISMPYSKIKESVANILKESGFIENVTIDDTLNFKRLSLILSTENGNSNITEIVRISKPGRRSYASSKEIPVVKRGRGLIVVSTSKGIMSGEKAKENKIGGELICRVY